MKQIATHFRRHGLIHAIWLFSVLLALIAFLLLRLPNGQSVGDYIAFAASIASLVLAIVAIGQSLLANQSFSETIGSLRQSSEALRNTALNVEKTSGSLSGKMDELAGSVARMPEAFDALSAKIEASQELAFSDSTAEYQTPGRTPVLDKISSFRFASEMILYASAISLKENVPYDPKEVVGEASDFWKGIMTGGTILLADSKFAGITMDDMTVHGSIRVKTLNLGDFEADSLIESIRAERADHEFVKAIDAYFAAAKGPSSPEETPVE